MFFHDTRFAAAMMVGLTFTEDKTPVYIVCQGKEPLATAIDWPRWNMRIIYRLRGQPYWYAGDEI